MGEIVLCKKMDASISTIDIKNLVSGIYFIYMNNASTKKFIKQ